MAINKYNEDDLIKLKRNGFLSIGELKALLKDFPDDGLIFVQRVEDMYFEGVDISGFGGCPFTDDGIFPEGSKGDGCKVLLKDGYHYKRACEFNEAIKDNEYEDDLKPISEKELENLKVQYSPVFQVERYGDDHSNIFLNLHY
jgi:hypothetical protein